MRDILSSVRTTSLHRPWVPHSAHLPSGSVASSTAGSVGHLHACLPSAANYRDRRTPLISQEPSCPQAVPVSTNDLRSDSTRGQPRVIRWMIWPSGSRFAWVTATFDLEPDG